MKTCGVFDWLVGLGTVSTLLLVCAFEEGTIPLSILRAELPGDMLN